MNKNTVKYNNNYGTIVAKVATLNPSELVSVIKENDLSSQIIGFANSRMMTGLKIASLAEAIIVLGFNTVKAMVIDSLVVA